MSQAWYKRIKRGRGLSWFWRVVLLLVVVLAVGAIWVYDQLQPAPRGTPVKFTIVRGESTTAIAADLEQQGIIRNAFLFRALLSLGHKGHLIQAGEYSMTPGTPIAELVTQMEHGQVMSNIVRVTIPEGFTVQQIADRLNQMHVCTTAAFMSEVAHGKFTESFLSELPKNPKIKDRLEGYLFPDTYDFVRGESPHQVIDEMLRDFEKHVTPAVLAEMKSQHLTLAEAITEASMVEKEAKVNFERPIIASVIDNRLKHQPPMKLQIDATVLYVIGHRNIVTDADLQAKSPYNTYLNYGLPPGPIANPGLASIMAVLHPSHTNYLYYVVKNNGTGEDYFATTFAEQERNIALSQANLKKYGH